MAAAYTVAAHAPNVPHHNARVETLPSDPVETLRNDPVGTDRSVPVVTLLSDPVGTLLSDPEGTLLSDPEGTLLSDPVETLRNAPEGTDRNAPAAVILQDMARGETMGTIVPALHLLPVPAAVIITAAIDPVLPHVRICLHTGPGVLLYHHLISGHITERRLSPVFWD